MMKNKIRPRRENISQSFYISDSVFVNFVIFVVQNA
jgi:hypothetical protein